MPGNTVRVFDGLIAELNGIAPGRVAWPKPFARSMATTNPTILPMLPTPVTLMDGVRSLEMVLSAYEAAHAGRSISISYPAG